VVATFVDDGVELPTNGGDCGGARLESLTIDDEVFMI
jgi:hypothetical protein